VAKAGQNECWFWTAGLFRDGYGQFRLGKVGSFKRVKAHRVAWYLATREQPILNVCHICDNLSCCNPNHLRLGSPDDNTQDKIVKGGL